MRIFVTFGLEPVGAFGLNAREFQFFREDLGQFFHGPIHFEDMGSRSVSDVLGAVFVNISRCERSFRFAFALSYPSLLPAAEAKVGHLDMGYRDADAVL